MHISDHFLFFVVINISHLWIFQDPVYANAKEVLPEKKQEKKPEVSVLFAGPLIMHVYLFMQIPSWNDYLYECDFIIPACAHAGKYTPH